MNRASVKSVLALPAAAAVAAILLLAAGCGQASKGSSVSGKITYKGQPLTGGIIKLYSDAAPAPATRGADNSFHITIKPDGTFGASNVPEGMAKVAIESQPAPSKPAGFDPKTGIPLAPGTADFVRIPQKYTDPNTSGLTWDVKPGSEKKDFDLTD